MLLNICCFPLPWSAPGPGLPYPTCGHWGTLSCLFFSSLRLNCCCKEERKYSCLKDFNPEANFSIFLLGVHLACSLGLTDFLVSCSDLPLHGGDLRARAREGKGGLFWCCSRTESTGFTEGETKPNFSSDSQMWNSKAHLCTAVSMLMLEILKRWGTVKLAAGAFPLGV